MDILTAAFLAGAGMLGGIIAAIVGGAAIVIYPALIATGVPTQLAAVSTLASTMPATMLAALSDRSQLPPFDRAFISLIVASVVGAGTGAMLLVLTPERMFAQIVPLLLGFATLLFAYSERISRWLRPRGGTRPCDCIRHRQSQGGAAGLVLWWVLRRRRGHHDARCILTGDRRRLSLGQCRQEFRLESQRICCHRGVRHAGRRAVAADPGSRCRNDRGRIDRRLCRARHSAQRGARADRRRRYGTHNSICAALLVLACSLAESYSRSRCNSIGNGVGSHSFCSFRCSTELASQSRNSCTRPNRSLAATSGQSVFVIRSYSSFIPTEYRFFARSVAKYAQIVLAALRSPHATSTNISRSS